MQYRYKLISKSVRCAALVFTMLCVVGCATKEKTVARNADEATGNRVRELEDRLKSQDKLLLRMQDEMRRLKAARDVSPSPSRVQPHPTPSRSRKILTEESPRETFISQEEIHSMLGLEDESVVDSSQESMHLYYSGAGKLEAKKYDEAVRDLRQFIEENPQHVYADRAQFLIADAYFQSKEYGLSVVAATLLETRYPYSIKIPEVLYKKGTAFKALKQPDQAKLTFLSLLHRFPQDPMSQIAKKEIAQ